QETPALHAPPDAQTSEPYWQSSCQANREAALNLRQHIAAPEDTMGRFWRGLILADNDCDSPRHGMRANWAEPAALRSRTRDSNRRPDGLTQWLLRASRSSAICLRATRSTLPVAFSGISARNTISSGAL